MSREGAGDGTRVKGRSLHKVSPRLVRGPDFRGESRHNVKRDTLARTIELALTP